MSAQPHYLDPAYRATFIGGSEAGAIVGLNPWKTPLDVWRTKVQPCKELENDNGAQYWGRLLEPALREAYTDWTGYSVRPANEYVDRTRNYLVSHLDGIVEADSPRVYESKTTGFFMRDYWGEAGSDNFPDHVKAQCEVYMHCAGLTSADVVVLIGGQDFRVYHYEQDKQFLSILLNAIDAFWHDYVIPKKPPPPMTHRDCDTLFALDDGSTFEADTELAETIYEAREIKAEIKDLEALKEKLELRMKQAFGRSQVMLGLEGEKLASWKTQQASRIDVKRLRENAPNLAANYTTTTESRVLRY